jgi:FtsZ-interacting cell division protein ZipA
MTLILSLLKNKLVIYGAIALCAVLFIGGLWLRGNHYANKLEALKAQHNAEKVAIYEAFQREAELHNARLQTIEKETNTISQQIKNLKIEGRCIKDEAYYNTINTIIERYNRLQ